MIVNVTDSQIVGETVCTLFTIIQPSPVQASVFLKNSGVNTLNYDFQEFNDGVWQDIGASGTDYNNTLSPGQVILLTLDSSNTKVQLLGNASGGALLEFAVSRYFNRASGGAIPILNL